MLLPLDRKLAFLSARPVFPGAARRTPAGGKRTLRSIRAKGFGAGAQRPTAQAAWQEQEESNGSEVAPFLRLI